MITEIEDYFTKGCGRCDRFDTSDCAARHWAEGLDALRQICRDAGLAEAVKWGHPCYLHAGRNIAIIGAFRDNFRLSFFNAALMRDPDGVLERQGPNTLHASAIRFDENGQVAQWRDTIRRYLHEAMGYADAGLKPPCVVSTIPMPDELTGALDTDPALACAFQALTPGRQKSYLINLNAAKSSATRKARILKFRDRILAGKGVHDR